jgi:hypothetical protein
MKCQKPVNVTDLVSHIVKENLEKISGHCAECGTKVNRLRRA